MVAAAASNNNSKNSKSMDNNDDVIAATSTIITMPKAKKEVMDEAATMPTPNSNHSPTQYADGIGIDDNNRWCNVDNVCNFMGSLNNSTIDDSTYYNDIQKKKDSKNSHIIEDLSYVGKTMYDILKMKHDTSKNQQWNVTNG
jgi:hypothetical protein